MAEIMKEANDGKRIPAGMQPTELEKTLIKEAFAAREHAYAPYSDFAVGAALLAVSQTGDGKLYPGCNIENMSYGATVCAERTAFFKAVSEGQRQFTAIAICGGRTGEEPQDFAYPCGICRQVMSEFCKSDFKVIVAKSPEDYKVFTLAELLPCSFAL